MTTYSDSELMQRALLEAARALGRTRPNPAVGCVIAKKGRIIAAGYHERAGLPHAEQMALKRAGKRACGADAYVTLEPCDHYGRTGPCTKALIDAGVRRVFVGMRDPNPIVDGRGLRRLRKAGIEVTVGVEEGLCQRLNEAYAHYITRSTPFVTLKIAQSLDGRVATRTGKSRWITGPEARECGHQLRDISDAIIVGVGTVLSDDPKLTCRIPGGRDPIRIVVDSEARTPPSAAVIRVAKRSTAPTVIAIGPNANTRRCTTLERAGAELLLCKARQGRIDLDDLLAKLGERGLLSVLVEGGPTLSGSFVDAGLIDKICTFIAPTLIGGAQALGSVLGLGAAEPARAMHLGEIEVAQVGADLLIMAYPSTRPARR